MDINKLNGKFYKSAVYVFPFLLLLAACLNFLFYLSDTLPPEKFAAFTIFHLFYLLSLGAVCGNIITEIFIACFDDDKNSSLKMLLYGNKRFWPIRPAIFVAVFIAADIILTLLLPYLVLYQILIFIVPALAIFFNASHFISGRIRFINGTYIIYREHFSIIISYFTDEKGTVCFVTSDGKSFSSGVEAAAIDYKALSEELEKNGLKSSEMQKQK